MQVKAKKALGQHFLTDLGIASKIARTISEPELAKALGEQPSGAAAPSAAEDSSAELKAEGKAEQWSRLPVVEIGPGMGVLTRFLVEEGKDVTAIELDAESVAYLGANMPDLRVVEGDFLKLNLDEVVEGEMVLIGNYPYNISSQIFFKVLENREKIPVVSGMLQKEVAERICASPGGKVYGILSVLLQAWYDCRYLFSVPPGVFSPPPKVQSGVLRLTRNSRTELGCDEKLFKTVVKTAFGQRRKTLRNSLAGLIAPDSPLREDPILALRPERLSVEDFIRLTKALQK